MFLRRLFCCCGGNRESNRRQAEANNAAPNASASSSPRVVEQASPRGGVDDSVYAENSTPRSTVTGSSPRVLNVGMSTLNASSDSVDLNARRSVYRRGVEFSPRINEEKVHVPTVQQLKNIRQYLEDLCDENPERLVIDLINAQARQITIVIPAVACLELVILNAPATLTVSSQDHTSRREGQKVTLMMKIEGVTEERYESFTDC